MASVALPMALYKYVYDYDYDITAVASLTRIRVVVHHTVSTTLRRSTKLKISR